MASYTIQQRFQIVELIKKKIFTENYILCQYNRQVKAQLPELLKNFNEYFYLENKELNKIVVVISH